MINIRQKMLPWKLDVENNFKPPERSFSLPNKLLVSAESTNCSPRVVSALGKHSMGVVCEEVYEMMDDIRQMAKYVFQTKNQATLALQNTASGGLEAALANLVEPGEKIIVAANGYYGDRMVEIAKIRNIKVVKMESKIGEVFSIDELEKNIIKHKPVLLLIIHGELFRGTMQPLEGLADICHKYNCLFAVDAVATLGGVPFFTDLWGIDLVVSGSHKAIGAPPGMSLITISPKALERMKSIVAPPSFYYNIIRLCEVWNCFGTRTKYHRYHYTFNSHMLCALREALLELVEEGLENVWVRQQAVALKFWDGIKKMGLKHIVEKRERRLWTIHLFHIPTEVNWNDVMEYLSEKYQVVLGFVSEESSIKTGQIALMGYNARPEVVDYVLNVLYDAIQISKAK